MNNLAFFHNVLYAICIIRFFNSHISVVVCGVFDFGTVSKWCIREWVKPHSVTALVINGILKKEKSYFCLLSETTTENGVQSTQNGSSSSKPSSPVVQNGKEEQPRKKVNDFY